MIRSLLELIYREVLLFNTSFTDIRLINGINTSNYDLLLAKNGDLAIDNNYDTALIVTFFTQARALASQVINSENRSGWWGNAFNQVDSADIGSLLWVIFTLIKDISTVKLGDAYLKNGFSWFQRQEKITAVRIAGSLETEGIKYLIELLNGNDVVSSKTLTLWRNTGG